MYSTHDLVLAWTHIAPRIQHLPRPPGPRVGCKLFHRPIVKLHRIVAIVGTGRSDKVDTVALKGVADRIALYCQSTSGATEQYAGIDEHFLVVVAQRERGSSGIIKQQKGLQQCMIDVESLCSTPSDLPVRWLCISHPSLFVADDGCLQKRCRLLRSQVRPKDRRTHSLDQHLSPRTRCR